MDCFLRIKTFIEVNYVFLNKNQKPKPQVSISLSGIRQESEVGP